MVLTILVKKATKKKKKIPYLAYFDTLVTGRWLKMIMERWANIVDVGVKNQKQIELGKGGMQGVISLDLWKPIELLFLYGTICSSNPGLRFPVLGCALIWFKPTTVLATVLRSWSSYWLHGLSRESLRNTRVSAMKRDSDTRVRTRKKVA